MPRYRVLPYKQGSRSAAALAAAINGRVLKLEGSRFRPRHDDVIVNWGNPNGVLIPRVLGIRTCTYLNPHEGIPFCSNKLNFFRLINDHQDEDELIPRFWENAEDIPEDAFPIVCRCILNGHSGAGIVIASNREELVPAPLYVQYIKKKDEYRVHVGRRGDEYCFIAVQKKAKRLDVQEVNYRIRNHGNGFVFVRHDIHTPASVLDVARKVLQITDLDFGAVDVVYNEHYDRAYVLEINTAPGLEGQTITDYANFILGR
jgi:glutathione synthase/RimK-type ligase-like ATP-grasp enzyme